MTDPASAAFDAARVAAFLRERYGPTVGDVRPFEQGEWSRAFAFRQGAAERVVRFSPLVDDFAKDRFAGRWRSPRLPIPRVLEIGPVVAGPGAPAASDAPVPPAGATGAGPVGAAAGHGPAAPGGFFAISERLYGGFIDDLDGPGLRRLLPSLFATLDAARMADLGGTVGFGLWDADGNAPHPSWAAALLDVGVDRPSKRIAGWRAALEGSAAGVAAFDEAYRALAALAPALPNDRYLVHSDLLHFNVLVADDRVTGLLDWGCGLYGDFLYDLAWITFWGRWYAAWDAVDVRAAALRHYAAIGLAVPRFAERLRACELQIGLDGLAYQAFRGFWSDLAWTARRTLEVARSPL